MSCTRIDPRSGRITPSSGESTVLHAMDAPDGKRAQGAHDTVVAAVIAASGLPFTVSGPRGDLFQGSEPPSHRASM